MADTENPPAEGEKPAEEMKMPDALGVGDKPPAEGETPAEKPADATKEVKVEYDLKLPEGFAIDEAKMGEFKSMAAEQKLAPEAAQKFIDRYTADIKAAAEEPVKAFIDLNKQWVEQVNSDKEIGGDNLASVKATVAKALDRYGSPEAREALILTGAGNNPAIIKMFHRMAKELVESGAGPTGNPRGPAKTAAERFYPNLPTGET